MSRANLCVKIYINSIINASPIFTFHRRILSKLIMFASLVYVFTESSSTVRSRKRPGKRRKHEIMISPKTLNKSSIFVALLVFVERPSRGQHSNDQHPSEFVVGIRALVISSRLSVIAVLSVSGRELWNFALIYARSRCTSNVIHIYLCNIYYHQT